MTTGQTTEPTNETVFSISENLILEKTGLTRRELRERRGPAGERWKKCGAQLLWSPEGLAELEREIAKNAGAEATAEAVSAPPVVVMTVVRRRNDRVLHVVAEGGIYDPARPVCVWLPQPRAQLFNPGMLVAVTARQGREDLFDLVGNPDMPGRRWPRRRGKW
jgi:hypothetical protein